MSCKAHADKSPLSVSVPQIMRRRQQAGCKPPADRDCFFVCLAHFQMFNDPDFFIVAFPEEIAERKQCDVVRGGDGLQFKRSALGVPPCPAQVFKRTPQRLLAGVCFHTHTVPHYTPRNFGPVQDGDFKQIHVFSGVVAKQIAPWLQLQEYSSWCPVAKRRCFPQ